MGKTQKPIKIRVHPSLWNTLEVQDLVAKQNDVATLDLPEDTLYLGPNGWRMTLGLIKHLPIAVKAWRDLQYGVPNKEASTGEDGTKSTKASSPRKRTVKKRAVKPTVEAGDTTGQASDSAGLSEAL